MSLKGMESRIWAVLEGAVAARAYPFMVALIACLLTLSMTIPFASILIGAVLLNRERWIAIAVLSSFGSALGGLFLYSVFHHLGWSGVIALYPELTQSRAWSTATRWVSAYGTWTLFVFAASPFPQTPALIFTAVSRLPILEVFTALLFGKLFKYVLYGFVAARFPEWVERFASVRRRDCSIAPRRNAPSPCDRG
jgi:membrane protein YqaA with SNARE-associated domain